MPSSAPLQPATTGMSTDHGLRFPTIKTLVLTLDDRHLAYLGRWWNVQRSSRASTRCEVQLLVQALQHSSSRRGYRSVLGLRDQIKCRSTSLHSGAESVFPSTHSSIFFQSELRLGLPTSSQPAGNLRLTTTSFGWNRHPVKPINNGGAFQLLHTLEKDGPWGPCCPFNVTVGKLLMDPVVVGLETSQILMRVKN